VSFDRKIIEAQLALDMIGSSDMPKINLNDEVFIARGNKSDEMIRKWIIEQLKDFVHDNGA
jgi:hypothetical protein